MKPLFTSLIRVAIVLLTLLFASCSRPADSSIGQLVEISCDPGVQVASFTNFMFTGGPMSTPGIPQTRLCLFMVDAELLFLKTEKFDAEQGFYHLYLKEDGSKLDFRFDGDLLYVNDRVRAITIDNGGEGTRFSDWVDRASEDDLRSVRILNLEQSVDEAEYMPAIEHCIRANPTIGLIGNDGTLSEEMLALWKPPVLLCGDELGKTVSLREIDLSELRFLSVEPGLDQETLSELKALPRGSTPKLYHFRCEDFCITGDIDLAKLANWVPTDEEVEADWPGLGGFFEINGIRLLEGGGFTFDNWTHPEALKLLMIGNLEWLTGAENLAHLECLGVGNVQEERLRKIIAANKQLVFLDLYGSGLRSFDVVAGAKELEGIVLCEMPAEVEYDFAPLSNLKHLRYVSLPRDLLSEPAIVEKVRTACPNCIIGGHEGICLGAGWLVLFLPLLGFVLFLKRFQGELK